MVTIDDAIVPGRYVIRCDAHEQVFEFEAEDIDQAEEELCTHILLQHSCERAATELAATA
jgi:hypothetical protein